MTNSIGKCGQAARAQDLQGRRRHSAPAGPQFPKLEAADKPSWREHHGRLVTTYDPALVKMLAATNDPQLMVATGYGVSRRAERRLGGAASVRRPPWS
jgi:hypothetical protein